MRRHLKLLAAIWFTGASLSVLAVQQAPPEIMLEQALADLKKKTGNNVEDRRAHPTNPKLKAVKTGEFWKTLDAIGKETGIGFSAYQPDSGVALVDKPYRELKTHYSGPFRFAVKRIAVSRDDETQVHTCLVTLDAAWEPRLAMLYLNVNKASVGFGKGLEELHRQTAQRGRRLRHGDRVAHDGAGS